jgi:hypothetical protein
MGQVQHSSTGPSSASGFRFRPRICLRKSCECSFEPRRWNQRYCQAAECLRLVRRWQAAKRQSQHRRCVANRQKHALAERQRRQRRCREVIAAQEDSPSCVSTDESAWSRSKSVSADFCDRPGCYESTRPSIRIVTRYCSDSCREAVRRVIDRERKWLLRHALRERPPGEDVFS